MKGSPTTFDISKLSKDDILELLKSLKILDLSPRSYTSGNANYWGLILWSFLGTDS